jgi:hypothetical protein
VQKTLPAAASCLVTLSLLNVAWLIHLAAQDAKVTAGMPFAIALIYAPFLLGLLLLRRSRVAVALVWLWAAVSAFRLVTLAIHAGQGHAETLPWIYWDVALVLTAGGLLMTSSARFEIMKSHVPSSGSSRTWWGWPFV